MQPTIFLNIIKKSKRFQQCKCGIILQKQKLQRHYKDKRHFQLLERYKQQCSSTISCECQIKVYKSDIEKHLISFQHYQNMILIQQILAQENRIQNYQKQKQWLALMKDKMKNINIKYEQVQTDERRMMIESQQKKQTLFIPLRKIFIKEVPDQKIKALMGIIQIQSLQIIVKALI